MTLYIWFLFGHILLLNPLIVRSNKAHPPRLGDYAKVLQNLDKRYMPQWEKGQPVDVLVGFYMESISSIKATEMAFSVDLYLRQSWFDERLKHNQSRHYTINDPDLIRQIWTPHLYFSNAKSASVQSVTKDNKMLLVYPDGQIHISSRVIGTFACNLDLRNYPLDDQECHIVVLSYSYPESELTLQWFKNNSIGFNSEIELPEMRILGVETAYCNGTYTYGHTATSSLTEAFSCLRARLHFKREIGYHLVQTYIPTLSIVMISWISFWIDPTAIPARISLGFTTLLILTTMSAGLRQSLPPVSYAKAIDYWIGTCTIFVFVALLEFALVNSFLRKSIRFREKANLIKLVTKEKEDVAPAGSKVSLTLSVAISEDPQLKSINQNFGDQAKHCERTATLVDLVSRYLFPAGFLGFFFCYCASRLLLAAIPALIYDMVSRMRNS